MSRNSQNIDKLFREGLQNYEATPSSGVKERIDADLDKRDGFRGGFGGAKEGHGSGRNHNHFQTVLTRRQNVSFLAAREVVEKETTCAHDYERYPKLGRCCKNGA